MSQLRLDLDSTWETGPKSQWRNSQLVCPATGSFGSRMEALQRVLLGLGTKRESKSAKMMSSNVRQLLTRVPHGLAPLGIRAPGDAFLPRCSRATDDKVAHHITHYAASVRMSKESYLLVATRWYGYLLLPGTVPCRAYPICMYLTDTALLYRQSASPLAWLLLFP